MKKLAVILIGLLFACSCELDNEPLLSLSISSEITTDYLLAGDLDLYLDNQQVFRYKGKPGIETIQIGSDILPEFEQCFILHIATGAESLGNVTTATISIDGQTILNASDFEDTFVQFDFEICNLSIDSYMDIEIKGKPDTYLDIWIEGKKKPIIPTEGLYAYYPFDGNANDESGNERHGTPFGVTSTTDRFGNPNSAYDFDGGTDWVEAGFNLKEPTGSISLWFRTEELEQAKTFLFCQIHHPIAPATLNFAHYLEHNNAFYDIRNQEAIQSGIWMAESIAVNEWHHLVCIWGGEGSKLYYDGVLQGSTDLTSYDDASIINMGIGCYNGNFPRAHYLNGQIDEFRVYNFALDQEQVTALFTEGGWAGN